MSRTPKTPAAMASEPLSPALPHPFQPLKELTMKNLVIASALVSSLFATSAALAAEGSSCHFHGNKPASADVVGNCANQYKSTLIKGGKLDASWQSVQIDKAELVDGKKAKEWKVTFRNPAVTDASKQTLYIFFSQPGNFIAANFTGQ